MRSREFYLTMLGLALVEIRGLEVQGDPSLGWKIADMMHNVPAALSFEWTTERARQLREQLEAKASVHGLERALRGWEKVAEKWEAPD